MNETLHQSNAVAEQRRTNLSRRRFLRGVGVALALPAFESLLPANAFAASKLPGLATTATGMPVRLAFMYIPNGVNMALWYPSGQGKDFQLGKTMEPIAAFKDKLQVIANLDQDNASLDGAGDHARAGGVWLTGVRINKDNSKIGTNVSIDHVAAQQIGKLTRFPSLELIADKQVRQTGGCDSGYSCQYEYNLSWRNTTTPNAPEPNPRLVFERLFGNRANAALQQEQRKSVLDFVREDAKSMEGALASADKQKLDEYLSSIRELELRIEKGEQIKAPDAPAGAVAPAGIAATFEERLATQFEMLRLAFQTDSTRISTLLLARDGDDSVHNFLPGITRGHHTISHHQNRADNLAQIAQIEYWYMQQFAKFLKKMEDTKDADGSSLLDNSMLVYGGGNADPNRHTHRNLPTILVGGGGGTLNTGRYVNAAPAVKPMTDFAARGGQLPKGIPMCNFFLGMLDKLGVQGVDRFGDSNGKFTDL